MNPFPFVAASYAARSPNFEASRCINLYPEQSGSGTSKTIAMLIGTPGLKRFSDLDSVPVPMAIALTLDSDLTMDSGFTLDGVRSSALTIDSGLTMDSDLTLDAGSTPVTATPGNGGIRGFIRFAKNIAVVACGSNLYLVAPDGSGTLIGVIDALTTPVSMASNGQVVMVVTGPNGYVVNPTAQSVTQIVDPSFAGADKVGYIDGYFVFNKPGTQEFQITGLETTTIDPLDFASAEGAPDLLLSLVVDHREIWLFGENSTEVFFNSGNADFPFQRIQGAFIQQGIAAKNSCCRFSTSVAWLTANEEGQGMVVMAQGYQPVRISNHALEFAMQNYPRIDDAIGFSYQQEGHEFYQLTFPSGNATWVYDATTQLWHERAWRNPADGSLNRHRAQCAMAFANRIIVGDVQGPNLFSYDLGTYDDNGDPLPAIRQCPHVASPDNTNQFFHKLWVDMETGVGLNGTGQGSDPQVMLTWSDDGGHAFPAGNERWAAAGKIGARKARVNFRRLGKSRDRVFRVTVTDPVKRIFIGAGVETSPGIN